MPARIIFGSGFTPQMGDTRRVLWCKKLLVIQNNLDMAAKDHNYPVVGDTIWQLRFKCDRAARGD